MSFIGEVLRALIEIFLWFGLISVTLRAYEAHRIHGSQFGGLVALLGFTALILIGGYS